MDTIAGLMKGGGTGVGHSASNTHARMNAQTTATIKQVNDPPSRAKTKAGKQRAAAREYHKFGQGKLHSGSATGPIVTNPRQATAIAMHVAGIKPKKK